jgi:hypothetical protein
MLYCCRMPAPRPLLPVDVALVPSRISYKYSTKLVFVAVSTVWITTPWVQGRTGGPRRRNSSSGPGGLWLFAETTTGQDIPTGRYQERFNQTLRIFFDRCGWTPGNKLSSERMS